MSCRVWTRSVLSLKAVEQNKTKTRKLSPTPLCSRFQTLPNSFCSYLLSNAFRSWFLKYFIYSFWLFFVVSIPYPYLEVEPVTMGGVFLLWLNADPMITCEKSQVKVSLESSLLFFKDYLTLSLPIGGFVWRLLTCLQSRVLQIHDPGGTGQTQRGPSSTGWTLHASQEARCSSMFCQSSHWFTLVTETSKLTLSGKNSE
jgi:hypothetical protein